jgi:formate-dependent nitrite reductase membrane component NrfD
MLLLISVLFLLGSASMTFAIQALYQLVFKEKYTSLSDFCDRTGLAWIPSISFVLSLVTFIVYLVNR